MKRAALALAGLALLLASLTGMARAPRAPRDTGVSARLGPITVTATALTAGPSGTLTATMQVSTAGPHSDQLDAALAAGGAPVGVFHQVISLADMPADLTGCGGTVPPPAVVQRWMHYGPLTVPGRAGGPALPVGATLTVAPLTAVAPGGTLAITLYFADAGSIVLRLPVGGA